MLEIDSKRINTITKAEIKVVDREPEKNENGGSSGDKFNKFKDAKTHDFTERTSKKESQLLPVVSSVTVNSKEKSIPSSSLLPSRKV